MHDFERFTAIGQSDSLEFLKSILICKVSQRMKISSRYVIYGACCLGTWNMRVMGFVPLSSSRFRRTTSTKMSSLSNENMDYTMLGSSDLKVSKVCLGTMTFGQQNTPEEGAAQLDIATKEYGINFIDTAEMYPVPTKAETQGDTDRILAKWLKNEDRSKVIIASKVAGYGGEYLTWLPGRNGKGSRVRAEEIIISVDESLKRLGTDYIDLIQIHWPDRYVSLFGGPAYDVKLERDYTSFEEQLRAFDVLIKQGKVRYIGVSNETPYGVMKFSQAAELYGLPKVVSIQNSYSLLVRSDYEAGLVETCSPRHENVGLLAYSPLCGGLLTGKYFQDELSKNARLNLFEGYMER